MEFHKIGTWPAARRGELAAEVDGLPAVELPFVFGARLAGARGDGTGRDGVDAAGWAGLAELARLGRPLFRLLSSALLFEDL
jgi:hypothetical protein